MKYTFIGDCHGKIDILLPLLERRCNESDFVLQLGDMGLGFQGVFLPNQKPLFGFIRGNHDSPDLCRIHNNYAGEFGKWNSVFVIGGAYSIDWQWRQPGVSWWFNEQLNHDQREAALEAYIEAKPRIVASHDAPSKIGEMLLRDGGFRPEKWGSTQSTTADLLRRMFDAHQPKHWFFGHYHRDWQAEVRGCKFYCLNELAIKHLDGVE
jgi:hypothetical protein